jgi:hypothetical protein
VITVGFVAMVVPVGSWRFTSEVDANWTAASLSVLTQKVLFDRIPTDEQLVESFQTYSDVVAQQLKEKMKTQGRADGYVAAIQHFELYAYDETSAPSYEEFMLFINGYLGHRPLVHTRFDWTMAMPVIMSQSN